MARFVSLIRKMCPTPNTQQWRCSVETTRMKFLAKEHGDTDMMDFFDASVTFLKSMVDRRWSMVDGRSYHVACPIAKIPVTEESVGCSCRRGRSFIRKSHWRDIHTHSRVSISTSTRRKSDVSSIGFCISLSEERSYLVSAANLSNNTAHTPSPESHHCIASLQFQADAGGTASLQVSWKILQRCVSKC